jgi:hypothetical protein
MLSVWFRVIRVRFLLASIIAVSVGLALNWWQNSSIEPFDALLTFAGVMALHASVDLLNDFVLKYASPVFNPPGTCLPQLLQIIISLNFIFFSFFAILPIINRHHLSSFDINDSQIQNS